MNEVLIDTKKALILNGERLTEYEFDSKTEFSDNVILWSNNKVVIYSKKTGQKVYEYKRDDKAVREWVLAFDNIIIIDAGENFFFLNLFDLLKPQIFFDTYKIIGKDNKTFFEVYQNGKILLFDENLNEIAN